MPVLFIEDCSMQFLLNLFFVFVFLCMGFEGNNLPNNQTYIIGEMEHIKKRKEDKIQITFTYLFLKGVWGGEGLNIYGC